MEITSAVTALAALAQGTRLAAYRLLVEHGATGMAAGEIAARVDVPAATLSFHLKEMVNAGLIRSRQEGRFVFYSADFGAMTELMEFLTDHCCASESGECAPVVLTRQRRKGPGTIKEANQ